MVGIPILHIDQPARTGQPPPQVPVKKKPGKFEFTPVSRDELRYRRFKLYFKVGCLAYILVVAALAFYFKESLFLFALIFLFNACVIYRVGVTGVRAIVFPYSLWMIKNGVGGAEAGKYTAEFAGLVDRSYLILRVASTPVEEQNKIDRQRAECSASGIEKPTPLELVGNKRYFARYKPFFSNSDIYSKLKNLFDLIQTYLDINRAVIKKLNAEGKRAEPLIQEVTDVFSQMAECYSNIDL
mmetsp:Transcript_41230/g.62732  ORF Transcript_41230/g.62732 Transcript_41230/m.62732 type:complete len:241 (+) Transcript_41230:194-916(+)